MVLNGIDVCQKVKVVELVDGFLRSITHIFEKGSHIFHVTFSHILAIKGGQAGKGNFVSMSAVINKNLSLWFIRLPIGNFLSMLIFWQRK